MSSNLERPTRARFTGLAHEHPAMVVAIVALVFSMIGTATATQVIEKNSAQTAKKKKKKVTAGPQGAQGSNGAAGVGGATGANGTDGNTGAPGAQGPGAERCEYTRPENDGNNVGVCAIGDLTLFAKCTQTTFGGANPAFNRATLEVSVVANPSVGTVFANLDHSSQGDAPISVTPFGGDLTGSPVIIDQVLPNLDTWFKQTFIQGTYSQPGSGQTVTLQLYGGANDDFRANCELHGSMVLAS
jgi:hypothetical protein